MTTLPLRRLVLLGGGCHLAGALVVVVALVGRRRSGGRGSSLDWRKLVLFGGLAHSSGPGRRRQLLHNGPGRADLADVVADGEGWRVVVLHQGPHSVVVVATGRRRSYQTLASGLGPGRSEHEQARSPCWLDLDGRRAGHSAVHRINPQCVGRFLREHHGGWGEESNCSFQESITGC